MTFAILGAIALTFAGCSLISTQGRAYDVRGSWEIFAFCCLACAAGLVFICYRLVFKSKPALAILPDRVEYYAWSGPVMFDEIEEVLYDSGDFFRKRGATLGLRLTSGEVRPIPYFLMKQGPHELADMLDAAIARHRGDASPLS